MGAWSDLPPEILPLIAQRLTAIDDFASFSVVCKECHSAAAMLKKRASLPPRYPRLLLAEDTDAKDLDVSIRRIFNLFTLKTNGVHLPEARGRKCVGANYGWLFTIGPDLEISLFHPFSRQRICLPPMLTFPNQSGYHEDCTPQDCFDMFVAKVAISTGPLKGSSLNDECVIVAIHEECRVLAFARLKDTVWTNIQVPSLAYDDVIYYKGKFYAVDCHGAVVACDIDTNNGPQAVLVAPPPSSANDFTRKYLVESSGDLLLVFRDRFEREDNSDNNIVNDEDSKDNVEEKEKEKEVGYYTIGFFVFSLEESHDKGNEYGYKWKEVTTLGNRALFLGLNVSTSNASSDGIKANCIYFTDDESRMYYNEPGGGGHDRGCFNIEDGTIQLDSAGESRSTISPPFWYM